MSGQRSSDQYLWADRTTVAVTWSDLTGLELRMATVGGIFRSTPYSTRRLCVGSSAAVGSGGRGGSECISAGWVSRGGIGGGPSLPRPNSSRSRFHSPRRDCIEQEIWSGGVRMGSWTIAAAPTPGQDPWVSYRVGRNRSRAGTAIPDLERAVVEVQEDPAGDKRIVAFMVLRPNNRLGLLQLRATGTQLPCNMIPSTFIELEALPLTVNRKVDRRALQVAADSRASKVDLTSASGSPDPPPSRVWLTSGRDSSSSKMSVCDNFFELGGHSLLATQLRPGVQALFRIRCPCDAF